MQTMCFFSLDHLIGSLKLPFIPKSGKRVSVNEFNIRRRKADILLCLKALNFSQFTAKSCLDIEASIRYNNGNCIYDNENYRCVSGPKTYWVSAGYILQP